MTLNRSTTVELAGHGKVRLDPSDYLATGGEADIYRHGQRVIKLYHELTAFRNGQADKLALLAGLPPNDYVVAPRGLVTDTRGQPLGYYMDLADGEPMARAFTNDWRTRQRFTDQATSVLASRMLEVVTYAHGHRAVMADANELNWNVITHGRRGPEPRCLDVDSWAIGRWPATVVMPSIRDWHTTGITPASDYFAWGIVTFQLYTGIHPYKGTLTGYARGDLERRMRENASVFAPGVRLNQAVRDFSTIPGPLRSWYQDVFQAGARSAPPSPLLTGPAPSATTRVARISVTTAATLRYDRLYGDTDPALRLFPCGVVLLGSGALYDLTTGRTIGRAHPDSEVIRIDDGWLVARLDGSQVTARFINATSHVATAINFDTPATGLVRFENRLFAVTSRGLTELRVLMLGRPMLVAGQTWGALPHATKWFDGVGVQDTMGAQYLIAPFGDTSCAQIRVSELDGLRPVAGRAGNRFVVIVGLDRRGDYQQVEVWFDRTYQHYQARVTPVDSPDLNLAILPRGVTASIVTDGELVIRVPSSGDERIVRDRDATTAYALGNWDDRVVGIKTGQVWSLKLQN